MAVYLHFVLFSQAATSERFEAFPGRISTDLSCFVEFAPGHVTTGGDASDDSERSQFRLRDQLPRWRMEFRMVGSAGLEPATSCL